MGQKRRDLLRKSSLTQSGDFSYSQVVVEVAHQLRLQVQVQLQPQVELEHEGEALLSQLP